MAPLIAKLLWAALLGLGLAAVLGVLVAALGKRRQPGDIAPYLRSLQEMLAEDPEALAGEVGQLASVRPDAAASFLAVGAALRRKGDLGRAIRVHQELMAAPGLDPALRLAVAVDLALDFRQAGLLTKAVDVLGQVVVEDPKRVEALRWLRELHEQLGNWAEAVVAQERLEELGASAPGLLAHLRARHARLLLGAGRIDDARNLGERAVGSDPTSADAWVALAEIRGARGEPSAVLQALARAVALRPEALPLVLPRIEEARAELRRRGEVEEAGDIAERLLTADPDAVRAYRCGFCGLSVPAFDFRCSMCGAWDTVEVTTVVKGDVRAG